MSLRIAKKRICFNGIVKIMDEFCLQQLTLLLHRNFYLLCLAADGQDGSGLQLKKISRLFQVLPVYFREVAKT